MAEATIKLPPPQTQTEFNLRRWTGLFAAQIQLACPS
jgi:hypothetical protein